MGNKTVDCYECQSHGAGWLVDLGYNDFAGSGIVHLLGGTCALVGCIFIGPRKGRFTKDGVPIDMPGHSVPLAALGGFILLFGFLAFNGGSQVRSSNNISNVLNNKIRNKSFLDLRPHDNLLFCSFKYLMTEMLLQWESPLLTPLLVVAGEDWLCCSFTNFF